MTVRHALTAQTSPVLLAEYSISDVGNKWDWWETVHGLNQSAFPLRFPNIATAAQRCWGVHPYLGFCFPFIGHTFGQCSDPTEPPAAAGSWHCQLLAAWETTLFYLFENKLPTALPSTLVPVLPDLTNNSTHSRHSPHPWLCKLWPYPSSASSFLYWRVSVFLVLALFPWPFTCPSLHPL